MLKQYPLAKGLRPTEITHDARTDWDQGTLSTVEVKETLVESLQDEIVQQLSLEESISVSSTVKTQHVVGRTSAAQTQLKGEASAVGCCRVPES